MRIKHAELCTVLVDNRTEGLHLDQYRMASFNRLGLAHTVFEVLKFVPHRE